MVCSIIPTLVVYENADNQKYTFVVLDMNSFTYGMGTTLKEAVADRLTRKTHAIDETEHIRMAWIQLSYRGLVMEDYTILDH